MPATFAVVPPEVIGAIFELLVPKTLVIPSGGFDALSSVIQTCLEWRAIAFQLPHLWSDLTVRLHSWSDRRTIHSASQCLYRSQTSALSVRIHVKKYIDYRKTVIGISPPTFLFPHSDRIRRLAIVSPMDISSLILPNLHYLEVLAPGWEGKMDLNALVFRSGCTITQLSVGCILHWDQLLENTPSLEELNTTGTLPCTAMQKISTGKFCPALQSLTCAVTVEAIDIYLNMLESRSRTNEMCTFSQIRDVSSHCLDFSLDERQWEKFRSLKMRATITESSQQSQSRWWDSGW